MKTHPDDLALYVAPGCGYCEAVRGVAQQLGPELEERDAWGDPEHRAALLEARGRRTVPVLRIRREAGDEWMGESADIIDYLERRFGDGTRKRAGWTRWASHRLTTVAMWGLLLAGGVSPEPAQSVLWTGACAVAAGRSFALAVRTNIALHWAVGVAFAAGAVSIPLHLLGVAEIPWWYVAFAVAGFGAVAAWYRARAARRAGDDEAS